MHFGASLFIVKKDAEIKLADYDRTGGLGSLIRFNNIKIGIAKINVPSIYFLISTGKSATTLPVCPFTVA